MPRHTHAPARRKHDRGHVRAQADRWSERRWQQAKALHDRPYEPHPELVRATGDRQDSFWLSLPANRLARNPFNECSCGICSYRPQTRRIRRRREDVRWRLDWDDATLADAEPGGRRRRDIERPVSEDWPW